MFRLVQILFSAIKKIKISQVAYYLRNTEPCDDMNKYNSKAQAELRSTNRTKPQLQQRQSDWPGVSIPIQAKLRPSYRHMPSIQPVGNIEPCQCSETITQSLLVMSAEKCISHQKEWQGPLGHGIEEHSAGIAAKWNGLTLNEQRLLSPHAQPCHVIRRSHQPQQRRNQIIFCTGRAHQ